MEGVKNKILYVAEYPTWEHPFLVIILSLIIFVIAILWFLFFKWTIIVGSFATLIFAIVIQLIVWVFSLILAILTVFAIGNCATLILYWIYLLSGKAPFYSIYFERSSKNKEASDSFEH